MQLAKKTNISFHIINLIFIFVLFPSISAQDNPDEMFNLQIESVDDESFENSIKLYQRVLDETPDDPDLNFKLGFCYLNTKGKQDKSIQHFKNSVNYYEKHRRIRKKKETEYLEAYFYLAKAYKINEKYDTAISTYKELKQKVSNKRLISIINKQIFESSKKQFALIDTNYVEPVNLGKTINSEYSDHSPFITADDSVLMFTSRRDSPYNSSMADDEEYDENIYVSHKLKDGTWSKPKSIGDNINTSKHEAVIGLSVDGQHLLLYKSDDKGSIYESFLDGEVWSKPKKLGSNINTRSRETHASISAGGLKLYFTSDRKGGYGGLDIYVSHKQENGSWGKAINLGPTINTSEDERAPYIHADGKTLYFSSKGHGGLGGFDIYSARLNEFGTWNKPENIGFPINTISDDVYYIPTASGKRSYYASSMEKGMGKTDLYSIDFKNAKHQDVTIMTGKIAICRGNLPSNISIMVQDSITNEVVGIFKPNSKTGKFIIVLNKGFKYLVQFETMDKIIHREMIYVPKNSPYQQLYKLINIPVDPPCDGSDKPKAKLIGKFDKENIDEEGNIYDSNIKIKNILFPSNSVRLSSEAASLTKIANYLKNNPNAIIEIGSYADASGMASYNYRLTVRRSNYVKKYLLKLNVPSKQLIAVGYGEENPIALNRNKNGTWNNTGKRYNRRIEFRVIKQGKTTLYVKPIINIPEHLINKNYKINYKKDPQKHLEIEY